LSCQHQADASQSYPYFGVLGEIQLLHFPFTETNRMIVTSTSFKITEPQSPDSPRGTPTWRNFDAAPIYCPFAQCGNRNYLSQRSRFVIQRAWRVEAGRQGYGANRESRSH